MRKRRVAAGVDRDEIRIRAVGKLRRHALAAVVFVQIKVDALNSTTVTKIVVITNVAAEGVCGGN